MSPKEGFAAAYPWMLELKVDFKSSNLWACLAVRVKIGELAKQAGLNPSAIRHYEKMGVLSSPYRATTAMWTNWFDCLRSRKQPNATVHNGFSHSVACIMAAESYWSGKKMYFDLKSEVISDRRLKTEVGIGESQAIGKSA